MVVTLIVLPLICMGILYHRMVHILQQTQKRFKMNRAKSYTVSKKRRAMRTTLLILGSFLIAWIPSSIQFLLTSRQFYETLWSPKRINLLIILSSVINMLMSLKLLFNPLIYALRIPEIMEALRRLLKQCFQSADDEIAKKRSRFRLRSYKSLLTKGLGTDNNSSCGSLSGRIVSMRDFTTTMGNGESTMFTRESTVEIPN